MRGLDRRVWAVAALLLALLAATAAAQQTARGPIEPPTPQDTGRVLGAPEYDWSLRWLDGSDFRLKRYRGRAVVLNAWATWCAPCIRELASFERLAASVQDTAIAFLFVSPESPDRVRAFLRRHPYALPFAVEDQRMPPTFDLQALPTTWILAPDGTIVLQHRGAADWNTPAIRRLLHHLTRPNEKVDPPES